MPKFDAVVIGGGHNGLVCAAYLARAGRKVLVLERRELLGGCAVTEEIWPGYRVSTGAYLTSLMQERIVRELDLPRFGYQVDAKDPAFFSAFPDGRNFFMWQDRAKTLAEIAKYSRRDAEVYPAYEDQLERLSQVVEGLLLTTPPQFPPGGFGDFVDYLRLAARLRGLGAKDTVALVKIFTQSAAELLDEWFESEQVKVTLATDGVIGANGRPAIAGNSLHFAAPLDGRSGRASRIMGFRARRDRRGLRIDCRFGARERRGNSDQRSGCAGFGSRRPRMRRSAGERRGNRIRQRGVEPRSQSDLPAPGGGEMP